MNAVTEPLLPIDARRPGRRRPWDAAAFALALLLACGAAAAAGLEGRFAVRSADLELSGGVYQLNARFELPIGDAVREGLAQGVPLTMEIDLQINRVRQLLPNSGVAAITQRYHLQYNAVSAHYVLRNENSGQQETLPSLDAALEELSRGARSAGARQGAAVRRAPLRGECARQDGFRHGAQISAHPDVLGQ